MADRRTDEVIDAPLAAASDLRHPASITSPSRGAGAPSSGADDSRRVWARGRLRRASVGSARRRARTLNQKVILSAAAILAVVLMAGSAFAEPPQLAAKRAEAQRVLAEIQSLDAQLGTAIEAYDGATEQLAAIDRDRAINSAHLEL